MADKLSKINSDLEVSIKELLTVFKKMRFFINNKEKLENTLGRVTIAGTGKQGLINFGTKLKFKTFQLESIRWTCWLGS
jgi:D-arabinose 5-phosphate isomerase GutQ